MIPVSPRDAYMAYVADCSIRWLDSPRIPHGKLSWHPWQIAHQWKLNTIHPKSLYTGAFTHQ